MIENKTETAINNILTLVGAACLAYPIINEITKEIAPKIEQLSSPEFEKTVKQLADGTDKHEKDDSHYHDEIADLKKRLEEAEQKQEHHE